MPELYGQSIFTVAHTDVRIHPFGNQGRTLRLVVDPNTDAVALKVQFTNEYGEAPTVIGAATLALCDEHGATLQETQVPLTFGGRLGTTLPPGETAWSDQTPFVLRPGETFALSIYYPEEEKVASGNWVGTVAQRSAQGNFTADMSIPGITLASRLARTFMHSDMSVAITSICEIVALRETPGSVIACFGDSITQQGNWTVPFFKLVQHTWPGSVSVCNLGISGNRLLQDSPKSLGQLNGRAGIHRFAQNVLALEGLTHVILELGSNDIGLPDGKGVPLTDLPTPEEYLAAMAALAEKAKERGAKAYVATIAPRVLDGKPYNASREVLRLQMNELLRHSPAFDAVLDFDEALRRTDGEGGMREGCALPDGLHPSPFGGLCIAKSIDLSLFGG